MTKLDPRSADAVSAGPRVELLYFDGCPNHEALLPHLRALLDAHGIDAPIHLREITSAEAAVAERFLGSPTLRIDGEDVDPGASERDDYGLKCRLYAADGGLRGPAGRVRCWRCSESGGSAPRCRITDTARRW